MSHNRSKRVPPRGINTIFIFIVAPPLAFVTILIGIILFFFVHSTVNFRPVDKLCPGKRLCRMEWERARKKDAGWRQKEARIILFKFNAVAERRQWSSAASIPRRKKPGQIVPPFLRCKCSFAPDLPFAQRSLYSGVSNSSISARISFQK